MQYSFKIVLQHGNLLFDLLVGNHTSGVIHVTVPNASGLQSSSPLSWAMSEGYGAHLIRTPELVADMVQQARARTSLPISIKIRIHTDLR